MLLFTLRARLLNQDRLKNNRALYENPPGGRTRLSDGGRVAQACDGEPAADQSNRVVAHLHLHRVAPGRGGRGGAVEHAVEDLRALGLRETAHAEADMPALILLDALDALANAWQDTVGQIVEQRPLPGREDGSFEDHVVEGDAVENLGASRRQLLGERRQPRLEQLEQAVRHEPPRRGEPLAGRLSGQLQDLGGDTIEELRVTILVA